MRACVRAACLWEMASRKLLSTFNMVIPAGKATPQPPVGSALGQRGLKLMDFCKAFNDQTAVYKADVPIRVQVKAFADRSFTFDTFGPPTTYFLLKAAGVAKGASRPGHETVGRVTVKHVYEIAQAKLADVYKKGRTDVTLRMMCRAVAGSARSMGIEVVNPYGLPASGDSVIPEKLVNRFVSR